MSNPKKQDICDKCIAGNWVKDCRPCWYLEEKKIHSDPKKPIFTQKHFIALAEKLAVTYDLQLRIEVGEFLADYFSDVNPKFKRELFLRKAKVLEATRTQEDDGREEDEETRELRAIEDKYEIPPEYDGDEEPYPPEED
jgi:hypothetical protein